MKLLVYVSLAVLVVCLEGRKHHKHSGGLERRGQHHHVHHHRGAHLRTRDQDVGMNTYSSEDWKMTKRDKLDKPEECRVLKCRKRHLCLVNAETGVAECVHKRLLRLRKKQKKTQSKPETEAKQVDKDWDDARVKDNYYYQQKLRKMKVNSGVSFPKQYYYNPKGYKKNTYDYLDEKAQKKAELHARKGNSVLHTKGGKVCTKKDLDEMGRRLLDWFKLLQEEEGARHRDRHHKVKRNSKKKELREEGECRCQAPVSWEFDQLDLNDDLQLDELELDDIKNNGYEHCVAPFIQACDNNHDAKLSQNEWCCCFEDVLPPCLAAQQRVPATIVAGQPLILPGAFVPTCDEDGFFQHQQCHPSTGYCWCVDRNGHELPRTKKPGEAECGNIMTDPYSSGEK